MSYWIRTDNWNVSAISTQCKWKHYFSSEDNEILQDMKYFFFGKAGSSFDGRNNLKNAARNDGIIRKGRGSGLIQVDDGNTNRGRPHSKVGLLLGGQQTTHGDGLEASRFHRKRIFKFWIFITNEELGIKAEAFLRPEMFMKRLKSAPCTQNDVLNFQLNLNEV